MSNKINPAAWMAIVLICFTGMAGLAWQHTPSPYSGQKVQQDTTPLKEGKKERATIINGDLNKAMEEVQKAEANLEHQLQSKDWEKMQQDLQKAQAELNAQNIGEQVEKAMKEIDLQKIQLQTEAALQKIDWEKMQKDLMKAQAELKNNIDPKKIDAEISRSMEETKKAMAELKAVDMEKIREELEKAKMELKLNEGSMQEDIERAKKEINENIHKDFRKEFEKAQEEVKHAAAELQNYKDMVDEMYKDGLIKSREQYDIHYKNGDLFINGTKQPAGITGKYKHYFKKENVKISRGTDEDDKTIDL